VEGCLSFRSICRFSWMTDIGKSHPPPSNCSLLGTVRGCSSSQNLPSLDGGIECVLTVGQAPGQEAFGRGLLPTAEESPKYLVPLCR
jgi:hypothetical protein